MPDPLVGLHPSEPCSSRVAVRRLRRLALLDVGCPPNSASRAHRSEHRASSTPWCLHPKTQTFQNRPLPLQSAEAFHNNMRIGPPPSRFTEMSRATRPASFSSCCAEAPHSVSPLKPSRHRQPKPATNSFCQETEPDRPLRLQGFAPRESPPLHTSCLGLHAARSSHGLYALQGVLPHCGATAFTASPLMGFAFTDTRTHRLLLPYRVSPTARLAFLPKQTADPPGLCRLLILTDV
jgi:hypothetical protein